MTALVKERICFPRTIYLPIRGGAENRKSQRLILLENNHGGNIRKCNDLLSQANGELPLRPSLTESLTICMHRACNVQRLCLKRTMKIAWPVNFGR